MIWILSGALIVFVILLIILYRKFTNTPAKNAEKFKKEFEQLRKEAAEKIKEDYDRTVDQEIKHAKLKLTQEISNLELVYKNKQEEIEKMQNEVEAAEQRRNDQLISIAKELAKEIESKSKQGAIDLAGVAEYYEGRKMDVVNAYNDFVEDIQEKKTQLSQELTAAQEKQKAIIAEYQRAEQIRQDKDFYRIQLSNYAIEDVQKLRRIAEELHDPSVLYKLIYKTYYERPFNEMIGRVVPEDQSACGIYKITNIENGRVYIGQTRQAFKERWRTHVKRGVRAETGTMNKLYQAMWDEGVENFTFEVLQTCKPEELNTLEKDFISLYQAAEWGYNSTGGNS